MLELGKSGAAGYGRGELPVLRKGSPVALLRASNWREAATAVVGDREWVFTKRKGELLGRWSTEPEDAVRLRARSASFWKGTWNLDLEGRLVEMRNESMWKGAHRYMSGGKQVARSGSAGWWSSRPTLDGDDDALPLHQQVFLLWLELVISRRNTAVAAGSTAAVIGGTS